MCTVATVVLKKQLNFKSLVSKVKDLVTGILHGQLHFQIFLCQCCVIQACYELMVT